MNLKKITVTWLVNIFIISLILMFFLRKADTTTWVCVVGSFSVVTAYALFLLKKIFIKVHHSIARLFFTLLLAFLTSVLAVFISVLLGPSGNVPISNVIGAGIAMAVFSNIALFWYWGFLGLMNFFIYSFNMPKANIKAAHQ